MEALADYSGRALGPEPRGLVAEQCPAPPAGGPRLLTRVREAIRTRHLSPRTEEAYVFWIRRYVLFHGKRHPLLRDSPARGRLRYPYGSRAPRSPRRADDDGLHARPQSRRPRRGQPCRPLGARRLVPCGIRSRSAAAHLRETGCDGFPGTGVFSATSSTSRSPALRSG